MPALRATGVPLVHRLTRIKVLAPFSWLACLDHKRAATMAFKTIMVQLDVDALAAPRISVAWDLARRHDAELIGFCAAEPHFVMPTGTDDRAATRAIWSRWKR